VQGFCVSISISQRLFLALFEAQKVPKLFSSKASSNIQQAPYSFDEALLLCEQDEGRWVAWIPDFGEIILIERQFEP
jgi:hypothetical protein